MPRPFKPRAVRHEPTAVYFKPAGIPMRDLEEVGLGRDELEAIRLADLEGLSQEDVGQMMKVSRATVGRILAGAHGKVARALVDGCSIRVEGGVVESIPRSRRARGGVGRGRHRGQGRRRGIGRGRADTDEE
jgi:predicted DNA-binding protein (UPF0251 family)